MTSPSVPFDAQAAIRKNLRLASGLLAFVVVGVFGLAAVTGIRGAVIAPGVVVVASDVKKVQHPTGGVVSEIRVDNGSRVRQGDVLLALDPTTASANVSIVGTALDELQARGARLEAERDARAVRWPADLTSRRADPAVAILIRDETHLLQLHLAEKKGQKEQLHQRIEQLGQQVIGFQEQIKARQQETVLIQQELVGVRDLYRQKLVPLTRLNTLERSAVELDGDVAQLTAQIAEAKEHIAEIQLQIIQVDQSARSDAGNQLTDVQNRLAELRQRKVAADQDYRRILIRAPQAGVVDRLNVHTIGGVIGPGEAILYIVPDKDNLHVEAKVRPSDVDQVKAGQSATMRFSAFNVRRTPEVTGTVATVSADVHTEERSGVSYYVATIDIPPAQLKRLAGLKLIPGMPAETFIQTERRSMLSYITRPLTDQFRRAFREE